MASVIVVGGGLAGLACAWRLRRAGHDVEVLEREPDPGGRLRSERSGAFVLERGAAVLGAGQHTVQRLVEALGLAERLRPLRQSRTAVVRGGRLEAVELDSLRSLVRSRLLAPRAKLRLARLVVELSRERDRLDPLRPELAAPIEHDDAATWLARTVGLEARDFLLGPLLSFQLSSDIENLSDAFVLIVLRGLAAGSAPMWLEGGLGTITRSMAEQVPVRRGCEVHSVETETGGARVRYRVGTRERSAFADAAVMCVPGSEVTRLCPKLTPAERGFFQGVRYARGLRVHMLLERRPLLPFYALAIPAHAGLDLYGASLEHHKPGAAPPGSGLVAAAFTEGASARLWNAADQKIAQRAIDHLEVTPLGRLAPHTVAVDRFEHCSAQFGPGSIGRLAGFLRRVDASPRLAFAGDYLVGPYTEAALTSGVRAASETVRLIEESR